MPRKQTYEVYTMLAAGATKTFVATDAIDVYELNANGGAIVLLADMIFTYSGTPEKSCEFKFQYGGGVTQSSGTGITVSFFGTNLTDAQALVPLIITAFWNGAIWEITKMMNADNFYIQNGNSFGADAVAGTNDAFALQFKTNNVKRIHIDETDGNVNIGATTDSATKLKVTTTASGDGIDINGALTPTLKWSIAGVEKVQVSAATSAGDVISTTAAGDSQIVTADKDFRINVLGGGADLSSVYINAVNGKMGIGTETTRATLHIGGSLAIPVFNNPTVVNTSTIAMSTLESTPFIVYSVNVDQVLTLTPLTPDITLSTGNAGRIICITNTGLGHIDFGGSALVKDITGATFGSGASGIAPGTGHLFIVMQSYMQQLT